MKIYEVRIDDYGNQRWYQNNELHRENAPACISSDGTIKYYRNNLIHRDGAPAIIQADGTKMWWQEGQLHREDGPAIERADGYRAWFTRGLHVRSEFVESKISMIQRARLQLSRFAFWLAGYPV